MTAKTAAIEGWYTLEEKAPHLIGTQCTSCKTYYFPKQSNYCRNPDCQSENFKEVPLSRTGKIWSYTNASYKPPEPFVAPENFVPFTIAAVELEQEKMIILGQMIGGVDTADIKVGDPVELVMDPLYEDEDGEKLIWKWKPVGDPS
ncbi:MAG: Zn-ribbon domain-containing OB-fold protein [Hellea sp.]|nr:Zn-ribbon domain-containing OB-fold protein [Hellea sp.]